MYIKRMDIGKEEYAVQMETYTIKHDDRRPKDGNMGEHTEEYRTGQDRRG